jgi:hypothetical protein
MNRKRLMFILFFVLASAGLLAPAALFPAQGFSRAQSTVPDGFEEIRSEPGAALYRKNYDNGNPDFVQVVDLSEGASVRLLAGETRDSGAGKGMFGGDSPTFARQPLRRFWNDLAAQTPNAFCVVNGAFFSPDPDPTPLAFPLKVDGRVVSEGYGRDEFPGQRLMLELWRDRASIQPLSEAALRNSDAPNILAGLAEDADKDSNKPTGRTFAGVADRDANGTPETVLLFATQTSTQADAAAVLRSFGAVAVMMLDGGGSTQLHCGETPYITSNRTLPQAVAVLRRAPPPLSAEKERQTSFPVLVEGESTLVEVELRNTGTETWRAGDDRLVNLRNPYGAPAELPLQQDIAPNETVLFSYRTDPFERSGVYATDWQMRRASTGEDFEGGFLRVSVIVLPKELAEKRAELEAQVRQWVDQKVDDIEALILAWIQEQLDRIVRDATRQVCGSPLVALALLAAGILWRRGVMH